MRQPFSFLRPIHSLYIWLGAEKPGQQSESHIDAVTVEGLEEICGRPVDVNEVRGAIKDIVSKATASDGAQVFLDSHLQHPASYMFYILGLAPPTPSDFGGLSRS